MVQAETASCQITSLISKLSTELPRFSSLRTSPTSTLWLLVSAADVGVAELVRRSGRPVDRRALGRPAAGRVALQPGHAAAVRGRVWR